MKSKNKDRKPHESIIGKIIYGFLLFMPLLAIGVTCAYAIFNKNAKDSYSDKDIYQQFVLQNNTQWVNDVVLTATYKAPASTATTNITLPNLTYLSYTPEELNITQAQYDTINTIFFVRDGRMQFKDTNNVTIAQRMWKEGETFNFISNGTGPAQLFSIATITETTYVKNELDNVFYYSIDKVQQSPLFNWAENSLIYTGMTNTCNALNITTPFIPLLMTYWLIISVIYILYDIILVILHIFHKKIHQLEDSF